MFRFKEEHGGQGIETMNFFCCNCKVENLVSIESVKDMLATAQAGNAYLLYRKRLEVMPFGDHEIKGIAKAGESFLRTKNTLIKNGWTP